MQEFINRQKRMEIDIIGMSCVACAEKIERSLERVDGVLEAMVNLPLNKGFVNYDESLILDKEIIELINAMGYKAIEIPKTEMPLERLKREKESKHKEFSNYRKKMKLAIICSVPFIVNMLGEFFWGHQKVPFLQNLYLQLILATIVQFFAGFSFYKEAFFALRNKSANMSVLIILGTSTAYFFSLLSMFISEFKNMVYFEMSAVLITLVLVGKYLETNARGKTSEALQKLLMLQPKKARVERNKEEILIKPEEIEFGDIVIVLPGERIAADGVVVKGNAVINEAMLTGESMPVNKKEGDMVYCGTLNHYTTFYFKALKLGKETMLSHIVHLVETAQLSKPPIQRLADKIAAKFVPAILLIAFATFVFWYFFLVNGDLGVALKNFVAVLVVSCPCALGLATPTSVTVALGKAAERGILFKNGEHLEMANKITAVVFDKTATLTEGKLCVSDIVCAENFNEDYVLQYAASIEKRSEHPIGQAICFKANKKQIKTLSVNKFQTLPGFGATAEVNGLTVHVGKREFFLDNNVDHAELLEKCEKLEADCKTVVWVAVSHVVVGIIALEDTLRKNAALVVRALLEKQVEVWLLTGDNMNVAKAVAEKTGIKNVVSEALPEAKLKVIEKLKKQSYKVAMVGDGINDAPALAASDIGIAMNNSVDATMEVAHVTIVNADLRKVLEVFEISQKSVRNIKQNLFFAFIYNIVAIPLAAIGFLTPVIAGLAMALSSISVVLNSLRLNKELESENKR